MNNLKLFCLAHAGGSSYAFMKWKNYLKDNIELVPIELAGKGVRWEEKPFESFEECLNDIYEIIKKKINSEYAIFGHSMGADLSFELTRKLQENNNLLPKHVFLSARKSPLAVSVENQMSILPDNEFINELIKLGGSEEKVFNDRECREIFLPIIRADYKMLATYKYKPLKNKLNVNFSVLYGCDDDLNIDDLISWRELTSKSCSFRSYEGGHFYIGNKYKEVIQYIVQILNEQI